MKKYFLVIITLIMCILLHGCGNDSEKGNEDKPNVPEEPKVYEMIVDNHFENGFNVSPANHTNSPADRFSLSTRINYNKVSSGATWSLAQHGCIHGFADGVELEKLNGELVFKNNNFIDGSYVYEDVSKVLKVNPEKSALYMELNASKEFTSPRKNKEEWPHLLVQEAFSKQVMFNELESLKLSLDVTLHKEINHLSEEEFDSSLHTSQYIMYIYVCSNSALDAGEFLYFGIPLYDYRYKIMNEAGMIDAGTAGNTGKFIYQMPTYEYLPNGLVLGVKNHIEIDILSSIARSLVLAQQYGKLMNSNINDLYITSFNIGFENPGTIDTAIEIEGLSLIATEKE